MSYILKNNVSFINTKITDIGRKKLSEGRLTFTYFRLGDSEVCYDCEENKTDFSDQFIFKPKDDNGDIKYPIPLNAALPTNTFNLINGLNSVENIIYNTGTTRGFFSGTPTNLLIKPTLFKAFATGRTLSNSLIVSAQTTSYNVGNTYTIASGDTILIKFDNNSNYLSFSSNTPSLFYQITSGSSIAFSAATGSTQALFTIDRVPYTGTNVQMYFLPGGDAINNYYGSTTPIPYWDETTLTFENNNTTSNTAVDVWNLNIPRTETILGTPSSGSDFTYYGSKEYFGSKEYLGYGSENLEQKSIAIIHYTNNTINNFYGEQFYSNTATLDLPRILYHKTNQTITSQKPGVRFSCGTTLKTLLSPIDNNVVLEYYDLIDSLNNIVGKVFPKLKIFVVEDEEVVAVMDYKSNRSWTLQEPNVSLTTPVGATGLIENPTEQVWVSYMLTNTGTTGSLPCQKYQYISNLVGQRDIKINFPAFSFPFLNTGFVATNILVLLQKTNIGERPKPESWKVIDCTNKISSFTTPNILSYQDLENTTFTISASEYNNATIFNLNNYVNLPTPAQPTILNFGDQNFFFGNVDTSIQATTYTSLFTFIIDGDKFNTSLNPTFRPDIDNVKFTEVGIYDDEFNLVGIAKMASPIERAKNGGVNVLQISVDF